jgi:hypothetical protein
MRLNKSLLEPQLILQDRFIRYGFLGVVVLWIFEFLMYGQRRR